MNIKEYLEDMLKDRNLKYKPQNINEDFYWGRVCLLEEILNDIKNKYVKIDIKRKNNLNAKEPKD